MKMMANCFSFRINFVGGVFGEWSFIAGVFVGSESFPCGDASNFRSFTIIIF
jgi:hypothetical protein